MPQPTAGDVHVSRPLTNLSVAFIQSASHFVADKVFPVVPVQKQADRYYVFDRAYFNRDEMQKRAPGTESAGTGYKIDSTPSYFCDIWALHHDIPDPVRANADSPLSPDRNAVQLLTQKALIRREKLWVSQWFKTGVWDNEVSGVNAEQAGEGEVIQWNDQSSTPIEDVRRARTAILKETGFEPNTLVLGRETEDALLEHPDIIDRIKYGQTPGAPAQANTEVLAKLFGVDRVLTSRAIENTAAEGVSASHSFIAGKHALLCYVPPEPGLEIPSAGYTFAWTGLLGAEALGARVKQFRMEHLEADRTEIEMAFDMRLVSSALGYFFKSIVGNPPAEQG